MKDILNKLLCKIIIKLVDEITIGFVRYEKTNKGWNCGLNLYYDDKRMYKMIECFKLKSVRF
jgi:hypothetical protein